MYQYNNKYFFLVQTWFYVTGTHSNMFFIHGAGQQIDDVRVLGFGSRRNITSLMRWVFSGTSIRKIRPDSNLTRCHFTMSSFFFMQAAERVVNFFSSLLWRSDRVYPPPPQSSSVHRNNVETYMLYTTVTSGVFFFLFMCFYFEIKAAMQYQGSREANDSLSVKISVWWSAAFWKFPLYLPQEDVSSVWNRRHTFFSLLLLLPM